MTPDRSLFFENSAEMLCIFNDSGYFLDLNKRWEETLGFDLSTLKNGRLINLIHPDDQSITLDQAEILLSGQEMIINFENRCRTSEGVYIWLSWNIRRVERHFYASARNISHLKEQQTYYYELQESAQIGYWQIDMATNTPIWSEKTYDIHGIKRGEHVDMSNALDFYPGETRALVENRVRNGVEVGASWDEEVPFLTAQNEKKWVRVIGKPTLDGDKVVKMHGTFQDITLRKKAELQIQYIIENVGDGFFDWHIQDDFEYMSPKFWNILGYDADKKNHHSSEWQKLTFEEDLKTIHDNFNLHASSRGRYPFVQEARFRHKNGTIVWVVRQGKVVEWDEDNKPLRMVGSHMDITQLKEAQERLGETVKLASLGALAGGIAHEINNPLTIIAANATLLDILTRKGQDLDLEKIGRSIKTISATVTRVSKIIDGMKQLSRQQTTADYDTLELCDVLDEPISLCLENMKSKCIKPIIKIKETAKVKVNATQVSQIILNLIGNAIDAVSEMEDAWIKIETAQNKNKIRVAITDSGEGIDPEVTKKIFEPFYTTKEIGKGTGLGLSISKEIIEKHSGRLYIDKSSTHTCFCVEFPVFSKCGN